MVAHERMLLVWCELDHSPFVIGMYGCEDPAVGPEVRMPHVGTLDGVRHAQRNTAEVVRIHSFPLVTEHDF
jgi:hypothetical protein